MGDDALALVSIPPTSTSISITSLAGEELSENTCFPVTFPLGSLLVREMMGVATSAGNLVVREWVSSSVDLTLTVGVDSLTG